MLASAREESMIYGKNIPAIHLHGPLWSDAYLRMCQSADNIPADSHTDTNGNTSSV
jgi:hypothetical protein